ncbi:hypothetical protein EX30DRAFT_364276 [Ascodesmis nigricans]|uniref:Uncharacterized protein n=1 Tax=Ascodesmis nigricans TaxID=341454 RepID=A0A4S2MWA4_9PEZI|nr:hypothetical protein EX30DRAFT_364276 [Ascodesmis nigricans]
MVRLRSWGRQQRQQNSFSVVTNRKTRATYLWSVGCRHFVLVLISCCSLAFLLVFHHGEGTFCVIDLSIMIM